MEKEEGGGGEEPGAERRVESAGDESVCVTYDENKNHSVKCLLGKEANIPATMYVNDDQRKH